MIKLLFYSTLALVVTVVLILVLRPVAFRIGLVDHPGGRKNHAAVTPLIGGPAIFLGLAAALVFMNDVFLTYDALLGGTLLLLLIGMLDDMHDLSVALRFGAQVMAALAMVYLGGVQVLDMGDLTGLGVTALGVASIPVTVFFVVGIINAFNMADGIDGLAGGVALVALLGITALIAIAGGRIETVSVLVLLAVAVAGFLAFNLRHPWRERASVFLGDGGSTMLGFVIVWFMIELSQGEGRAFTPITAAWLVALPLLDTLSVMIRRVMRGRNPFAPDHEHLHHILKRAGYTDRQTVAVLLGFSSLLAGIGIAAHLLDVPDPLMFYAFMAALALYLYVMSNAWRCMKLARDLHAWLGLTGPLPENRGHNHN
ncbi:MAG: MraY family glycosyltransferase [Chromatiales bacterium]|nr:MraY family glycosyltransferase [Chromatiales bacterium]